MSNIFFGLLESVKRSQRGKIKRRTHSPRSTKEVEHSILFLLLHNQDQSLRVTMPIYCASFFKSIYACPPDADLDAIEESASHHSLDTDLSGKRPRELNRAEGKNKNLSAAGRRGIDVSAEAQSLEEKYPLVRSAVTSFKLVRYDAQRNESIVECFPLTGRTHQIRVHLHFLGHPIANDRRYSLHAEASADSQLPEVIYLHAWKCRLPLPDGSTLSVETELPRWAA